MAGPKRRLALGRLVQSLLKVVTVLEERRMASTTEKVLTAALELSDADRIELIEALIDSLETSGDPPIDESWREVIRLRSAELASGSVAPVSWSEVKRRAREAAGG